ncbi:PEP-CTERM sorting domain-containing protein [Paucibacter sp. APW11]|uniref:PEP-CTERM sorting domain-containing protein n=1 Tax=Roseateles aquae TaxID=3077235 RepID=A0ABU3PD72_9BURK|nr:PEP-CTERM sorting domain-containing protein [Paucibacter sp. APW11]MDT9000282.1 PEP-CTERM sorting domain-containing protein [Paucibacter sp. APW11]
MNIRKTTLAAVAALLLGSASAQADSFTFSGKIDAGPELGQLFSGSYELNLAAVTGSGFEQLSLSSFQLNFLSNSYTLNASATADYQDGVFLGLSYSFQDASKTLVLTSGSFDANDAFLHYTPVNGVESSGSYTVAATPAVPEPSTLAMALGGLLAVGFAARRRMPG